MAKFFCSVALLLLRASCLTLAQNSRENENEIAQSTISMEFSEHEDYKSLSHEYDHLWDEMLPANGGFVRKTYTDGQVHGSGISMFHQLHCLQMMRAAYQSMQEKVDNITNPQSEPQPPKDDKPHSHHTHGGLDLEQHHWLHCFDYLRQAILCNADATIEAPVKINATADSAIINGMITRQCKDWKVLWEAAVNSDASSGVI